MDQAQALAIVRSLANGVDPESGEVFTPESAYQRPQVVRALYEAAAALERIERFERRRQQMPPKTGEPWSEDAAFVHFVGTHRHGNGAYRDASRRAIDALHRSARG